MLSHDGSRDPRVVFVIVRFWPTQPTFPGCVVSRAQLPDFSTLATAGKAPCTRFPQLGLGDRFRRFLHQRCHKPIRRRRCRLIPLLLLQPRIISCRCWRKQQRSLLMLLPLLPKHKPARPLLLLGVPAVPTPPPTDTRTPQPPRPEPQAAPPARSTGLGAPPARPAEAAGCSRRCPMLPAPG